MARNTSKKRKRAPQKSISSGPSWLSTYRPAIDQVLFILAILGVMVTVHLWIQQGRGFDQGCWGFNPPQGGTETFNCSAVVNSDAGELLGISNVYWGMFFYLLLAALSFAIIRVGPEMVATLKKLRGVMIGAGFVYSMQLVNYQFNSIGELCALCLTSAGIATLLFIVTLVDLATTKKAGDAKAERAAASKLYLGIAGVALVLIVADLVYFNNLEPAAATAAAPAAIASNPTALASNGLQGNTDEVCFYAESPAPVKDFESLLSSFDPTVGAEDAKVIVAEYFDPNCPHCQSLHPVMKQVIEKYKDTIRFHYKPNPLRNQNVLQIEALYIAKEQGKFSEMLDAQMALKETRGLSIDRVRALAEEIGMDVSMLNTRLRSGLYRNVIIEQSRKASEIGLNTVPAILINGRFVGSRSMECLSQFIEEAAE